MAGVAVDMSRFPAGALQGISALKIADCFSARAWWRQTGPMLLASVGGLEAGLIVLCARSISYCQHSVKAFKLTRRQRRVGKTRIFVAALQPEDWLPLLEASATCHVKLDLGCYYRCAHLHGTVLHAWPLSLILSSSS